MILKLVIDWPCKSHSHQIASISESGSIVLVPSRTYAREAPTESTESLGATMDAPSFSPRVIIAGTYARMASRCMRNAFGTTASAHGELETSATPRQAESHSSVRTKSRTSVPFKGRNGENPPALVVPTVIIGSASRTMSMLSGSIANMPRGYTPRLVAGTGGQATLRRAYESSKLPISS